MRLRGKGVPENGSKPAGDFYVKLLVKVPDPKSAPDRARDVAQRLDDLYAEDVRGSIRL